MTTLNVNNLLTN